MGGLGELLLTIQRKSRIVELIKHDLKEGKNFVLIGTDEAGRGPVAGPVTACAVCFKSVDKHLKEALKYLDDSKKFSANSKLRKDIAEEIKKRSYYSIQHCTVEEIEKYNILQASLLAMKKACNDIISQIQNSENILILVDGRIIIPNFDFAQKGLIKGDSKSASIASASILAKVQRDELMIKISNDYPEYEWHQNKGYPTPKHLEAIRRHGITKWHRKSFLTKCL
jgi:ribonuclease HII